MGQVMNANVTVRSNLAIGTNINRLIAGGNPAFDAILKDRKPIETAIAMDSRPRSR
jgi:hypothetical protein